MLLCLFAFSPVVSAPAAHLVGSPYRVLNRVVPCRDYEEHDDTMRVAQEQM